MAGRFLTFYIGCMASHKTEDFEEKVEKKLREHGGKKVLVIKPAADTRSPKGYIESWNKRLMEAVEINEQNPWETLEALENEERKIGRRVDVVAFAETQFYEDDEENTDVKKSTAMEFCRLIKYLLERGYDIVAEGLSTNFRGEPYKSTAFIAMLAAEACHWRWSTCKKCGEEARFSQRIIEGQPDVHSSPVKRPGGGQLYEPRCAKDFSVPGRPYPPEKSN